MALNAVAHFSASPMNRPMTTPSVLTRTAPPWRALLALAALVLAAHTLVLQGNPKRFGPELDPAAQPVKAFVTRHIEAPPPEPAVPPAAPAPVIKAPAKPLAKAAPKPVKKPILEQKEAIAQQPRAQAAIELVAPETPPPPEADAAPVAEAPAAPASDSLPATEQTASAPPASLAPSPAPAASAAPPAGPSQTPVTAMALPGSARLSYAATGSAKGLNYYADAELVWNNAGSSYDARMTVSALLLRSRSWSSRGQIGDQGLAPQRYTDKARNEVAAHFEPEKNQISFSANTPSVPWIKGAQDRVSVFLQLGGILKGNPAGFPVGSNISMYTVGPRDADTWTFLVGAEETLTLPFGVLNTVKLSRQPRREFDQKVEIWYAPSLGYLPVRSKITEHNGDFVDQQLRVLSQS
jgi:outer membrane biosynthesis protein TonB